MLSRLSPSLKLSPRQNTGGGGPSLVAMANQGPLLRYAAGGGGGGGAADNTPASPQGTLRGVSDYAN